MSRINNLVESNYILSLAEQRILYLACRQLRPIYMKMNIKTSEIRKSYEEFNFDLIKVYVTEYKNEYQIKSNNLYIVLADVAEDLNKKEISYRKNDGTYEDVRLGAFKYNTKEKCIEIMFNPDLIVDILALKEFYGKYKFVAAKGFKRSPSFRLYEIIKAGGSTGRRFTLEELKMKIGLEVSSYPDTFELKRSLLLKSIKEIKELTDLKEISIEEHLEVRKVVAMTFKAKIIEDAEVDTDPLYEVSEEEIGRMSLVSGIELTEDQAESLVSRVITTIAENKLDIGFYDYLKSLKDTNVIYSLV